MRTSTKLRRWQKIGIVALVGLFALTITCSAAYITIDERPLYVPLLDLDAQIERTSFDLTPSVYEDTNSLTFDTAEKGSTVSVIRRTNWEVHNPSTTEVYKGWRDVSYRLGFNLYRSADDFDLKLTSQIGAYNFTSYDLPMVSVPIGYTATYDIEYTVYYADGNTHEFSHYIETIYGSASSNDSIELLQPYYTTNGVNYDLVGNIMIVDYDAVISFKKVGNTIGESGYYTFNGILGSLPDSVMESIVVDGDYWLNTDLEKPFHVVGTREDGSTYTANVYALVFENDPPTEYEDEIKLRYEMYDIDEATVVYSMLTDEWYTAQVIDTETDLEVVFTPIQLRQLHFDYTLDGTFELNSPTDLDCLNWFINNTTYSPTSSVLDYVGDYNTTPTDGGIYVKYTCVDADSPYYIGYLKGYYDMAYKNGFAQGDGGASGFVGDTLVWLVNTVSEALSIEIFPYFSIGGLLSVIVAIGLTIVFLKMFAGG